MLPLIKHIRSYSAMVAKPRDPLIVILGATGTGKSQLAIDIARRFNGEIINGDAMQMYAGLPIITNKISPEEQQNIPHHLLGCIALNEKPWTVKHFNVRANQIIKEIRSRGKLPIIVGGTHYYTQSLLFKDSLVSCHPDTDLSKEETSRRLQLLASSSEDILGKLGEVDPVMADRWHPNDTRKIQNSLEIYLKTGRRASDLYEAQKASKVTSMAVRDSPDMSRDETDQDAHSPLLFWVHADIKTLKDRLNDRVNKMLDSGLLDEAAGMQRYIKQQIAEGNSPDLSKGVWISIGFKETRPYLEGLESNSTSPEELERLRIFSVEMIKGATRRYVNRQIRWIRLQLMRRLNEHGLLDRLYLVDSSDVSSWSTNVAQPAIDVTERFLDGAKRPVPQVMSDLAKEYLAPEVVENLDKDSRHFREECKVCGIIVLREDIWATHLKTRRHRASVRRNLKATQVSDVSQDIQP